MNLSAYYKQAFAFIFAFSCMTIFSLNAVAQAPGWSEQKILQQQTELENRVSLPAIAADGDNVYIAYRQGPIKIIISRDRGKNWQQPITLAPEYVVNSAPAIAVVNNKIVAVWPTQVETGEQIIFQLMYSESGDNGNTWSDPERITNSKENTFSPRFYVEGDRAFLLWMEVPPEQISTGQRSELTPESISSINLEGDSLTAARTQTRALFRSSTYTASTGEFTEPARVGEVSSKRLPHIFTIYGRVDGNIYVTANQNQEIKTFRSSDGQEWSTHLQDRELFDSRKLEDLEIVEGVRTTVWIRRTAYEQVAVNFQTENDNRPLQLAPPQYVRSLPRFTYSDGVFHVAWETGNQEESWITYIRTDEIPPTSTVVLPEGPDVESYEAMFAWMGEDNISSTDRLVYSYTIDDEPWSSLQQETQTTIQTPPDGEYVFKIRAEDVAGNIQDPPTEFPFNTYSAAPKTTFTDVPPSTEVLDQRNVTLSFNKQDNSDSASAITYSAQVDDGEWTEFTTGSQHTFQNLSNGEHVLRIRCKDSRGNIEEGGAETRVTIQVGIEVVWEEEPPRYSSGDSVNFSWSAVDDKGNPVELNYYYTIDGGSEKMNDTDTTLEVSGLDEGRHRISVWGVAASGDQTGKLVHDFLVDRTPPETNANFSKEYSRNFPIINLSAEDPALPDGSETVTPTVYEYRINRTGEWEEFVNTGQTWTLSEPLSFYSWGYVVEVRAIDAAGNVDLNPAVVNLRIYERTNPYIFWPIVVVINLIFIYIIYIILKKYGTSRPKRSAMSSSSAASTMTFDEDDTSSSDDTYGSSFMDDDEDDDKKDPYA